MENFVGRKVSSTLLNELKSGNYQKLLEYIKSDEELRLEVRREGRAKVYYKKCLALDLGARSRKVDEKYFTNGRPEEFDSKLNISHSKPSEYFRLMKNEIDNWQEKKNINKLEFYVQQKIATENQSPSKSFFIVDMEYNLSQAGIKSKEKRTGYDLVAIECSTGNIVLFEVKCGTGALKNKSGLDMHAKDFESNFRCGKNVNIFTKRLKSDIKNIVNDKIELGIITNFKLPPNFDQKTNNDIHFQFIYVYDDKTEEAAQRKKYENILDESDHAKRYDTVYMNFNCYQFQCK